MRSEGGGPEVLNPVYGGEYHGGGNGGAKGAQPHKDDVSNLAELAGVIKIQGSKNVSGGEDQGPALAKKRKGESLSREQQTTLEHLQRAETKVESEVEETEYENKTAPNSNLVSSAVERGTAERQTMEAGGKQTRGVLPGGLHSYRHPFRTNLIKALQATAKALSNHANFDWHITAGTLLAQKRSGGMHFIPWDADVDLATTATKSEMEAFRQVANPELQSAGFSIDFQDIYRVVPFLGGKAMPYGDVLGRYIDLYQYEGMGSGDLAIHCNGDNLSEDDVLPTHACAMVGIEVRCPNDDKAVLTWRYGENWEEADHKWEGSIAEDGMSGVGEWVATSVAGQGHATL